MSWQTDLTNSPCIDAAYPWSTYTNEPTYNGLRLNQGCYGNTEYASKTDYEGGFYSLSVDWEPLEAGSVSVWPVAATYPTNREVKLTATANQYYYWDHWRGGLTGSNSPAYLYLSDNTSVTGIFGVCISNTNGVPDWWLASHGIAPTQAGADEDSDLDGHLNWQEYFADTIPTNTDSLLCLIGIVPTNGGFRLIWKGGEWATQHVECCSNLLASPPAWSTIWTNTPKTPITNEIPLPDGLGDPMYWRIRAGRN